MAWPGNDLLVISSRLTHLSVKATAELGITEAFQLGTSGSGFVHISISRLVTQCSFLSDLSAWTVDHCAAGLQRAQVIRTEAKFHVSLLKGKRIVAVAGCLSVRSRHY